MKRFYFLSFIILFCQHISLAQFPNWSRAKSAGNGVNDFGNGIVVSEKNNIYVVGQFNNKNITFGTIVLNNSGNLETNDIFITKYDINGNTLWAKSIGGAGDDFGIGIAVDKSENVYITGGFVSSKIVFGKDTLKNAGQPGTNDAFIAKYSGLGELIWAKAIGGEHDDKANAVALDNKANVYITGSFYSSELKFNKRDSVINKYSGNVPDVFVVKYTTDGKFTWAESMSGSSEDVGLGITCDSHNNVYVTGGSRSSELQLGSIKVSNAKLLADDTKKSASPEIEYLLIDTVGNVIDTVKNKKYKGVVRSVRGPSTFERLPEKIFIVKYAASGEVVWAQTIDGSDNEEATAITSDLYDNVFITGRFQSSSITLDSTTLNNKGSNDIFIAKYTSDGKACWAKSVGGVEDDRGNNIKVDCDGSIYITGWFASPKVLFGKSNLINSGGKGFTDMFIAKYDTDGNALWAENAKGTDSDWGNGADVDSFGNIYVTGGFDSSEINFGETKLTKGKWKDFFLAKINAK